MKKLFTLAVLMILLGMKAMAGSYIYFTECPQLDYGTTTFDYTSVNLYSAGFSNGSTETVFDGWVVFDGSGNIGYNDVHYGGTVYQDYKIIDIGSSQFSNVTAGKIIRVNFDFAGSNPVGYFYEHQQTYAYSELDNVKSVHTEYHTAYDNSTQLCGYYEAVISSAAASYLTTNGINLHAQDMTITSVQIIEPASTFDSSNLTWTATPHAGISITDGYLNESEGVFTLDSDNPDDFTFSGTGFIVITCTASNGMKASYLITVLEENQKRHWDFTKHQLVIGPAGDTAWRYANDTNWSEYNYNQHGDSEILHRYNGDINNTPNGNIIAEVNGSGNKQLWFTDGGSNIAIRNEGNKYDEDHSIVRFVAVEPNVTVHIGNLQAGDRVRMLIDKYGNDMELSFTNALDALGNPISGTYQVGGSSDFEAGVKDNLNSYYNFIVAENGEFTFTQTNTACKYMKIFDIEVYRGDFKLSNTIQSKSFTVYNPQKNVNAYSMVNGYQRIANYDVTPVREEQDMIKIDGGYYLHHRGKDETWCDLDIIHTSHNLDLTKNDFEIKPWTKDNKTYYTDVYLKTNAQNRIRNNEIFGSYILRIKLYDATKNYVTDYADRIVSIGYIEKVNHPITWDFTDLKTYLDVENDYLQNETDYDYNTTGNTYYDANNDGYDSHLDLSIWKRDGNDWRLDFDRKDPNGAPFAWGTQLYAGTKMFDETRGIGFAPKNNNTTNYSLKITDGGLRIEDTKSNDWGWELSIHDLDGLAAVYIRYEPIANKTPYIDCQYNRVVDGTTGKPNAHVVYNKDVPDSNDKVQGHSAMIIWEPAEGGELGSGCTNEFKIYLNNVILKKIGTSKDQKKIGKTGYATESRARDIDHSLTSYFTGMPITAYAGYLVGDDYTKVVFKEFATDEDHKVMPAANATGVNNGCILYHAASTTDKNTNAGLDGGIHLFVPDMHDTEKTLAVNNMSGNNEKNIMLAFKPTKNYFTFSEQNKTDTENYLYMQDDDNTKNFILSAKKYAYGTSSNVESGYDVFFVRIDPDAKKPKTVVDGTITEYESTTGYAYLMKNSAYIHVPNDKVVELKRQSNTNEAKVAFIFEDELFNNVNPGITTGITDATQQSEQNVKAGWYMMDGRKINSVPTQKGLYIVNGKKVMVK